MPVVVERAVVLRVYLFSLYLVLFLLLKTIQLTLMNPFPLLVCI